MLIMHMVLTIILRFHDDLVTLAANDAPSISCLERKLLVLKIATDTSCIQMEVLLMSKGGFSISAANRGLPRRAMVLKPEGRWIAWICIIMAFSHTSSCLLL